MTRLALTGLGMVLLVVAGFVSTGSGTTTERVAFAGTLVATGGAGVVLALVVRSIGHRYPLRFQLAVGGLLGLVVLIANLTAAAALMFISAHDLTVLFVLCGSALAVTAVPVLLMSEGLAARVQVLSKAAQRAGSGDLAVRVPETGSDEVASLGVRFNAMLVALEQADTRRTAVEASRRSLFAAISHDLRTPLASLQLMVEAMSDGVVTDEATRQRYYAAASSEVGYLSGLIDDLFELTTIESGELQLRLELLDIGDIIREAADVLAPTLSQSAIALFCDLGPGRLPIAADAGRLGRVFANLLQNAIRHTPADGAIVVRALARDAEVVVSVVDTGTGIDPAHLPHIFERFYRGEPSRARGLGGAGLGLSIVRGIVEAHGGRIWVESTPGYGATFTMAFPAAPS